MDSQPLSGCVCVGGGGARGGGLAGSCHVFPCVPPFQVGHILLPLLSIPFPRLLLSTVILSPLNLKSLPHSTCCPTDALSTGYQLYRCGIFPSETRRFPKAGTMCFPTGHTAARWSPSTNMDTGVRSHAEGRGLRPQAPPQSRSGTAAAHNEGRKPPAGKSMRT